MSGGEVNWQGPCQGTETEERCRCRENPVLTVYNTHPLAGPLLRRRGPEVARALGSAHWFSVLKEKKKNKLTQSLSWHAMGLQLVPCLDCKLPENREPYLTVLYDCLSSIPVWALKYHLTLPIHLQMESLKPWQVNLSDRYSQPGLRGQVWGWHADEHWTHAWWTEKIHPSCSAAVLTSRGLSKEKSGFEITCLTQLSAPILYSFPRHTQFSALFCFPLFFTHSSIWPTSLIKEWSFLFKIDFYCSFPGHICFPGELEVSHSPDWYFPKCSWR